MSRDHRSAAHAAACAAVNLPLGRGSGLIAAQPASPARGAWPDKRDSAQRNGESKHIS